MSTTSGINRAMATLRLSGHVPEVFLPLKALRSSRRATQICSPDGTSYQYTRKATLILASQRPRRLAKCVYPQLTSTPQKFAGGVRSIFIQTESTPNPDALKFVPNNTILPQNLPSPFLEYLSTRSTLAPPYPSPLAARLLNVDGITSVFYGSDFITVTKASDANWAHIKPEVFSLITEAITSGEQIVNIVENKSSELGHEGGEKDTLVYDENDSEVVGMIKELLETRIRPAIQEDGGDIEFRGFDNGNVSLKLRGACRTCDSSTVTLKNGIESMLMHYIEEVKSVTQVLDREEEIAMEEFAKFEAKLKEQKGSDAISSTVRRGSLDTVEG